MLLVTCGVIETARARVVVDPSKLDAAALSLVPFEVLNGTRFEDIVAPPWRYFQYSYTVRVLGEEVFGRDVDIPPLQITYRVNTNTGDATDPNQTSAEESEGVEKLYVLPKIPIRVQSLVPTTANDIRDIAPGTFADVEVLRFRSSAAFLASVVLFGFAAVLAAIAAVRLIGRFHRRIPASARQLPSWAVLRGCLSAAEQLKSEVAREGWTPELNERALALLRIVGAVALGKPVAQKVVDKAAPEREGQVILKNGHFRPKRTALSAPTTAAAIATELSNGSGGRRAPDTEAALERLQDSLRILSAARYGRNGHIERDQLDTAFDEGASAIRQLYAKERWPQRAVGALKGQRAGATA